MPSDTEHKSSERVEVAFGVLMFAYQTNDSLLQQ